MLYDGGHISILIAHMLAFGSGVLKMKGVCSMSHGEVLSICDLGLLTPRSYQ